MLEKEKGTVLRISRDNKVTTRILDRSLPIGLLLL